MIDSTIDIVVWQELLWLGIKAEKGIFIMPNVVSLYIK